MSVKQTKIIDLNLFSGSSEALRQAAGGYYGDTENTGELFFTVPNIVGVSGVESVEESGIDTFTNTIVPRIKYASRLYVDPAVSPSFLSDEDWRTFIIGGTYADKTYSGLYNELVYSDHVNTSSLPYVPREVINVNAIEPSLSLTTEYFNYYARFQAKVNNLDSELQAPNYYLLSSDYFSTTETPYSSVASVSYLEMQEFLTNGFVNSENIYNEELENIFVLESNDAGQPLRIRNGVKENNLLEGYVDSDLQKLYSLMPFGNKLEIKEDLARSNNDFKTAIEENDYHLKFTKLLKEIFQGESGLQPSTTNFAVNAEAVSSTGILTGSLETTVTLPIRVVDCLTMLLYAYKNPLSETNNITVIDEIADEMVDYAFDTAGSYRYSNTRATLDVLNDFTDIVKQKFGDGTTKTFPLDEFLNQAQDNKYHETVAFRIEKIGGPPTGDANTENTIQNIWFYNRGEALTYFDTQVKYNSDYTYKIYKYDIVQGYKYQLSDAVVTRQLATTNPTDQTIYCLEFYDPFTGLTAAPLIEFISRNVLDPVTRSTVASLIFRQRQISSLLTRIERENKKIEDFMINLEDPTFIDANDIEKFVSFSRGFVQYDGYPYVFAAFSIDSETYGISGQYYVLLEGIQLEAYLQLAEIQGLRFSDLPFSQSDIQFITYETNDTSTEAKEHVMNHRREADDNADRNKDLFIGLNEELTNTLDSINEMQYFGEGTVETTSTGMTRLIPPLQNALAGESSINTNSPHVADFNITIEPSLKIIEIPLEEKRMRIVDHPPNDFVITPHHLLDQTNRLAFYCKYDTFSINSVTYPPTISSRDVENKSAYLTGNDFIEISEQTQESSSRARFIEVYRTTTKPTSYDDLSGNLRKTIDLKQANGDIASDHFFVESVRENIKYYYAFRSLNENGIAGQMSPVFETQLINDGGYVYADFEQYSEDDLEVTPPKEPLTSIKKLLNIVPNIQHTELNTSTVSFASSSSSQIDNITLGDSNVIDPLFNSDSDRYFKIRLTSKKTGRKLDINIGFKKEVRK